MWVVWSDKAGLLSEQLAGNVHQHRRGTYSQEGAGHPEESPANGHPEVV
jgi:hypothetical protein